MCRKIKRTVLLVWPSSWSTDVSSFHCSDINLFLIMSGVNYAVYGCSSLRTNPGTSLYRSKTGGKILLQLLLKIGWEMTSFKRQIKNRTLHTCRLFLLIWLFQYISNWSKVFELLATLFLDRQFFSWLCRFLCKLGQHFFIIPGTLPTLNLPINFESAYLLI